MHKYLFGTTDKPPLSYKVNEEIVFTVRAKSNQAFIECRNIRWYIDTDDGQHLSGAGDIFPNKPLIVKTSLSKPGFARLTVRAFDKFGGLNPEFADLKNSAGAEIEKLDVSEPAPADYDEFWGEIEEKLANFTPELIEKKQIFDNVAEGFVSYDVKISTFVDTPASGVITMPKSGGPFNMQLAFIGYGISAAQSCCNDNLITAHFNAHGCENDCTNFELQNRYMNTLENYGFNEKENEDPKTTYWYKMMIRNLCAAKYVKTLDEWNKKYLECMGGSQGALQAVTVAAHDKDVSFLEIAIPWFCNLTAERNGLIGGWRPKAQNGVLYYDTVYQAKNVKCPVRITAYLGDCICPASTVTTLYNNFKTNKQLTFFQGGDHCPRPEEIEKYVFQYNPENATGEFKKGIWRHYQGEEFELLGTATDKETSQEVVIYKSAAGGDEVFVEPAYLWNELVLDGDKRVKRVEFVR